jgi:hypothetical protein
MRRGDFETIETDPPDAIVVHPDDRGEGALVDVPDSNGCCGLDGLDGPNQTCAGCGAIVGTARTDCWTEKEMRFWPDRVSLR